MWYLIFASILAAGLGCSVVTVFKMRRLPGLRKLAAEHSTAAWIACASAVAVAVLVLCLTLNYINAVIVMVFLTLIWLVCELVAFIIKKGFGVPDKYGLAGVIALVATGAYLGAGWYLAHDVKVTHYTIETDKTAAGLRIVQFADSHIGGVFDANGLKEYIERINAEKPDVVLITGDFVDDSTSRQDMLDACAALSGLDATHGVYFSYGNHDRGYYSDVARGWSNAELEEALAAGGTHVLKDETVTIDGRMYIIGRKDRADNNRAPMSELTAGLDGDIFSVVMDHQPHDYAAQQSSGVDLVLSGHTHGGQFMLLKLIMAMFAMNDRIYGHERRGNTDFIVTSGIADWEIKFKTGCVSEYVVIDLV